MILEIKRILCSHKRPSKLGKDHEYKKYKSVVVLRCDNCKRVFERDLSKMEAKRRTNTYFHVCTKCDAKRFAQRKGLDKRYIWDRSVNSLDDISGL